MKMKYSPEEWANLTQEEKIEYLDSMRHVTAMYSVYDRISQTYGNIILNNKGNGSVSREFFELINDKNQKMFYQHPEDFELWKIGEFNERTGEIDTTGKTIICNGQQAIELRKTEE